jgi:ribosomal protein S20
MKKHESSQKKNITFANNSPSNRQNRSSVKTYIEEEESEESVVICKSKSFSKEQFRRGI